MHAELTELGPWLITVVSISSTLWDHADPARRREKSHMPNSFDDPDSFYMLGDLTGNVPKAME